VGVSATARTQPSDRYSDGCRSAHITPPRVVARAAWLKTLRLVEDRGVKVHPLVHEGLEVVPLTVDLDAAELHDSFDAFADPAHAPMVATLPDDALDCTLYGAGADLQVSAPQRAILDVR
jgi:hypothetical protein